MNKSKYNEDDRVGLWQVNNVYYRGKFGYVYELVRFEKTTKFSLTCTEQVIEQIINNLETTEVSIANG